MNISDKMQARGAVRAALAVTFGCVLFAAVVAASARADDGHWLIVASEGQVQIEGPGGLWTPVSTSNVVQPGSVLRTGDGGRVTVEHDGDRFIIAPNSQVELPKPTTVNLPEAQQTVGTVLYDMVPRGVPRFEVKTPYLAAVIKGTVFTVTVNGEGAAVHVTRGVVQVHSALGQGATLVYPGQTALVAAATKGEVHLIGPNTPGNGGKSATRAENAVNGLKSVQPDGNDAKIAHAIGPHAESIAALTQGLIPNVTTPNAARAGVNGIGNDNTNGHHNADAGLPANSVTGVSASAGVGIGNSNSNGSGNGNGTGNGNGNGLGAVATAVGKAVGLTTANGNNSKGNNGNGNGKH